MKIYKFCMNEVRSNFFDLHVTLFVSKFIACVRLRSSKLVISKLYIFIKLFLVMCCKLLVYLITCNIFFCLLLI